MLRRLFILLLVVITTHVAAQHAAITHIKNTEKNDDPQIDYKQTGAPMPRVRIILYQDSSAAALVRMDSMEKASGQKIGKNNENSSPSAAKYALTNDDLKIGANVFIMLFNPTCSHCEDETVMIEKNTGLFKKSRIYMLAAPMMKPYLPDFVNMMRIKEYPTFSVGLDSSGYMNEVFLYKALPQINIYSADHKLIKIYSGEVSIDSLKQYIE